MNIEENKIKDESKEFVTTTEIKESSRVEQPENIKLQNDLDTYLSQNQIIKNQLEVNREAIKFLVDKIHEIRNRLNIEETGLEYAPSLRGLKQKEKELEIEQIRTSANYPGDWTLLFMDRMLDPVTKQKFIETRLDAMKHMKPGEAPKTDEINFEKTTSYQSYYQNQIDQYDENVRRIFSKTHIGDSKDFDKRTENVGLGKIGYEGVVFSDTNLSVREKNIIEAHEKGHGLRDFVTEDARDFKQSIDFEVIRQKDQEVGSREIGYFRKPEEIAERMAQLKNYFGFKASDLFTLVHLQYAKKHYIQDIGYDNNMSVFLDAITPHTQDKFIETINKYPL